MDGEDGTPTIVLRIATQDGQKLSFRMKRDTKLIKLLLMYCDRKQVSYRSVRFLYHGKRVKGRLTPDLLNMEDGDEIDAMTDQDGGAPFSAC
ncbi:small ubiquitin-related modifier 1-like [Prosopis cineraria]|uniref:small ubiquitin-related modifier 1-like n=1 Tax=Prosopis cineraria TaxID=364024 RepID=UPI00240F94C3|nr:small ubiquitin-related modifier 1-like [Prosopis cineraria]